MDNIRAHDDYKVVPTWIVTLLKNGPTLASFIVYFRSFQTNVITIFTTNVHPVDGAGIRTHDLWNIILLP